MQHTNFPKLSFIDSSHFIWNQNLKGFAINLIVNLSIQFLCQIHAFKGCMAGIMSLNLCFQSKLFLILSVALYTSFKTYIAKVLIFKILDNFLLWWKIIILFWKLFLIFIYWQYSEIFSEMPFEECSQDFIWQYVGYSNLNCVLLKFLPMDACRYINIL